VATAAAALPVKEAVLDGEVVKLRPDGISSFQELQNSLTSGRSKDLTYFVFDLLHLDGRDLTALPLEARKERLASLVNGSGGKTIRYSDHQVGKGAEMFAESCRRNLEGIISKRRDSRYVPGRGRDWLKVKCLSRQEFVIGGWSDPSGARKGFGALLLGVYDKDRLVYCGRVGTGFTEKTLAELHRKLERIEKKDSPFSAPPTGRDRYGVHWVEPELVAEIAFSEWTNEGILRQPSFLGLREDKDPREVRRERAAPLSKAMGSEASASPTESSRKMVASRSSGAAKSSGGHLIVGGVKLSNPDKVLYPEDGITKEELARYYDSIADHVLPHVIGRPLMIVRCPEGYQGECFFQKHLTTTMPKAIQGVKVREEKGERTYIRIESLEGLIGLVQMGVLEIHAWGAPAHRIERPDRMIFDLDPDEGTPWEEVLLAARRTRDHLSRLGMESFLKTTGGKGLHVVVPLAGRNDWTEVKEFSRAVAESLVRESPDRYTSKMSKALRQGKIFIDYLRNARGATAVAAFSTRARKGAPVSAPIGWRELKPSLLSDAFTVRNLPAGLSRRTDPWKEYEAARVAITKAMRKGV
jgi:bifunctional non-homologous end joining protein LigD